VQIRIPPEHAGERLDVALAEHAGSRAHAQKLIDDGRVRVNGQPRAKRYKVTAGDLLEWSEPPPAERPAAADVPFTVAFEDDETLIVDKPAGVVVHPAPGHHGTTLSEAIPGGKLVHRLDRDTSGLLIVAKSDPAHRRLKELLQRREITREYLALVLGRRRRAAARSTRRSAATAATARACRPTPTRPARRAPTS
jgi:23S rRNA pseudouridine1911/1915/1917 synthase